MLQLVRVLDGGLQNQPLGSADLSRKAGVATIIRPLAGAVRLSICLFLTATMD